MSGWLEPVALASTPADGNIDPSTATLSTTIDGVMLSSLPPSPVQRVLLKHQANPSSAMTGNLTYTVNSGTGVLTPSADTYEPRSTVRCDGGNLNAKKNFALIDTTNYVWALNTERLNVRDFGAQADQQTLVGAASVSGTALTVSVSGTFKRTDVTKFIRIAGAGTNGNDFVTTLSAWVSGTSVTLTGSAPTSVSSATIHWGTDDTSAIAAAVSAAQTALNTDLAGGAAVLLAPGTHTIASALSPIPASVRLHFEENAMLAPMQQSVTIGGRVEGHPTAQIFGGTGTLGAMVQTSGSGGPYVVATGTYGGYPQLEVQCTSSTQFEYSTNAGSSWSSAMTIPASAPYQANLPGLGVTLLFPSGAYSSQVYKWTAFATTPSATGLPAVTVALTNSTAGPYASAAIVVTVTAAGNLSGMTFNYAVNGVTVGVNIAATGGSFAMPGTGITLLFASGSYTLNSSYTFVTSPAVILAGPAYNGPVVPSATGQPGVTVTGTALAPTTIVVTILNEVASVSVTTGGSGYALDGALSIALTFDPSPAGPAATATALGVAVTGTSLPTLEGGVRVTSGGWGYTSTPNVTFPTPYGGTAATGTASLSATVFSYSINGVLQAPAPPIPAGGVYTIPGTGLSLNFAAGTYTAGTTYTWTSNPPALSTTPGNDRFYPKWWGALGNNSNDDGPALATAASSIGAGTLTFTPGTYAVLAATGTLTLPATVGTEFLPGSLLSPQQALATLSGPLLAPATQQIFAGGTVWNMTQSGSGPSVGLYSTGAAWSLSGLVVEATSASMFKYSINGQPYVTGLAIPYGGTYAIPGTTLLLVFPSGTYAMSTMYTWAAGTTVSASQVGMSPSLTVNAGRGVAPTLEYAMQLLVTVSGLPGTGWFALSIDGATTTFDVTAATMGTPIEITAPGLYLQPGQIVYLGGSFSGVTPGAYTVLANPGGGDVYTLNGTGTGTYGGSGLTASYFATQIPSSFTYAV